MDDGGTRMLIARAAVFTVLVPGSVTVGVPALLAVSGVDLLSYGAGAVAYIGVVPIVIGAAVYLWCVVDFVFAGRGTPAPIDAPRSLVSRGLYRLVRNPMYVGVGLVLAGEAIVLESATLWLYAALLWLVFHLFVVVYEEPSLSRRFGQPYDEYRRAVPRWIPRIAGHHRRRELNEGSR